MSEWQLQYGKRRENYDRRVAPCNGFDRVNHAEMSLVA